MMIVKIPYVSQGLQELTCTGCWLLFIEMSQGFYDCFHYYLQKFIIYKLLKCSVSVVHV